MKKFKRRSGILCLCALLLFSSGLPVRVSAEESEIQEQAADQEEDTGNEEEKKETDKAASGEDKKKPEKPDETEEETEEPDDSSGDTEKEGDGADEKELIEDVEEETKKPVDAGGKREDDSEADSEMPEEETAQDDIFQAPEETVWITFYTMDEEGEYYELAEREADTEGHVEFPDVPYIEGYAFDCWQTEDFENVDEDKAFTESCDLYAVFDLQETEPEDIPAMHAAARASSIGISAANPQSGQQNRYEYSGSAVEWTVPATGYYDISCYGAQGGYGDYHGKSGTGGTGSDGAAIGRRYFLQKGIVLSVQAGSQPQQSTASGFGEGSTNGNPESVTDYGYYRKIWKHRKDSTYGVGEIWQYRGYPDGGYGDYKMTICNDNKNHSGGSTGGGGGGSSKVLCGQSVLISAKGGNGATASYVTLNNDGSGTTAGGGCSGTTSAASLTDAVMQNEWNYSGSNSGDGYIVIRAASILPMIELQANPSGWTNGDVTISAAVKNAGEGLPEEYLSWEQDAGGNDIWTSGEEFAASQNGTYTCKIRDTAGNVTQETVTITNIDKLTPEGEITADITEWTVSDIVLTAAAEDAAENTEYGKSGLDDAAYLWGVEDTDGNIIWDVRQEEAGEEDQPPETKQSEAWTGENSYTASQNGTYACRIRDKAGNVAECRYTVSNIDRTAPEIDYDRPDKWYDGENDITWIGNDLQPDGTEGSGLAEEAYSFDGVSFTALNTQRIPGAGVYKVWIRDKVGNTAEYEIEILYDRKPSSKGENISPDTPPVPVEQPPLPVIEPAGGGGNGGTDGSAALPEPIKVKQPQPEETLPILVPMPEPEPVKKQKTSSKIFPKEPELEISNKEIPQHSVMLPYIVGGTVSTGGMLYFILFFMAPIARIYELRAGRYIRKAWKFIMPGKKLDLRDCFENTEENKLIIRLGWLYSKRNRNHKITCIKLNGTEKIAIRTKTMIER